MSRILTGTLVKPDGTALGSGYLVFIAVTTNDTVLEGTKASALVSSDGLYSITLQNGRYGVWYEDSSNPAIYLGRILVETGSSTTLNQLLIDSAVTPPDSITSYIDAAIASLASTYQAAGSYLVVNYDSEDTPTTPQNLAVEIYVDETQSIPKYFIDATWDASTSASGNPVKYRVSYYKNASQTSVMETTEEFFRIGPVEVNETYYVEIRAYSAVNSNQLAPGYASATITVTPAAVQAISADSVTGSSTLKAIVLRWENPAGVSTPLIHVYADTDSGFTPAADNRVYTGYAETFTYQTDDTTDYYFKFIVQDTSNQLSSITGPVGPYHSIKVSETNVGQLIEAGAIQAQQIANGAIVQDKIAANAIVASKLAVLDLTNLVHNHTFTLYDSDAGEFLNWDFGAVPPITPGADGYAVFGANTSADNDLQFDCVEGDKFYVCVTLDWSSAAGYADKGFLLVFLDSSDNELTSGYTGTNADSSAPANPVNVEAYVTAPADAVKGFIRLKTGAVTSNITFSNIICRHGAAVLIEPEGITAEKINVADLFALKIQIESGGALYVGDNPGDQVTPSDPATAGLILGSAQGFQAYDGSGNLTVDINPSTGSAVFKGNISGSTLSGGSVAAGAVIVGTYGNIHSSGKDDYEDASAGFFLGYSGSAYKLDIGDGSNYLRWNGSALTVKGNLSACTITGGSLSVSDAIVIGSSGKIYSDGKTSYADTDAGFFLGYDSGYKFNIGDGTNYLKWTGTNVEAIRSNLVANGTVSSVSIQLYGLATYDYEGVLVSVLTRIGGSYMFDTGVNVSSQLTANSRVGYTAMAEVKTIYGDAPTISTSDIGISAVPMVVGSDLYICIHCFPVGGNLTYVSGSPYVVTSFDWVLRQQF